MKYVYLILASKMIIFIILCLFFKSIECYNDSIVFKEKGSAGAPQGDVMLQRVTVPVMDAHQLFWWADEKKVLFGDSYTDTIHSWKYDGTKKEKYIKEISGERLIFVIPIKHSDNKRLIASDQNLRILTVDSSNVTASDPVVVIHKDGYQIEKGHCDNEGTLYLIVCHTLNIGKPTLLYRVKDEKEELVHTFTSEVNDFVFSNDFKKMFVLTQGGFCVVVYDFDIETGQLSNEQEIYNLATDNMYNEFMSSIVIDTDDNLWITTKNANVFRLNTKYELDKIVETPFCGLTSIVFGGYKLKNILLGSSQECNEKEMQAGSILIMTGLITTGKPDELVKWTVE